MASGLPVIASSVGGLLELVRPGRNGLLIPHSDPAALAQAIVTLLDDVRLRQRMGAAARQDVFSRYSFDRMVGSIDALYLTELHRRRAVPPAAPTAAVS
jgi:glycosyltransferase involved in cell wall biosynthesis